MALEDDCSHGEPKLTPTAANQLSDTILGVPAPAEHSAASSCMSDSSQHRHDGFQDEDRRVRRGQRDGRGQRGGQRGGHGGRARQRRRGGQRGRGVRGRGRNRGGAPGRNHVQNERDLGSESDEDSESEEDSGTDEDSEEDSEEDMEDEQDSDAEEDNAEGESEAEGETEAESEFDPEIEMEAERVAKRKCPDHGLDLSTYCQEDRQLICVLCPVIGTHQGHQLSTLDEAFEELRSKDSGGLKAAMIELVERLKFKSSDPKVTRDQMKVFIQQEFKKVQKVIADEEQKALHLVDIQEAMATAHVIEILADIQSHMDRLMTQMAQAKEQLDTSNESAEPKAEGDEEGPRRNLLVSSIFSLPPSERQARVVPVKKRTHEGLPSPMETHLFPLCVCDSMYVAASDFCESCPVTNVLPPEASPDSQQAHISPRDDQVYCY
nr:tripartite motif-containing protein 44 [Vulpes vulpes]